MDDIRVCPYDETPMERNVDPVTDEVYWSCPLCGRVEED